MLANDIIQAYIGYHKLDEPIYVERRRPDGTIKPGDYVHLSRVERDTVASYLWLHDTPTIRLETYLHWNGIIGYTNSILAVVLANNFTELQELYSGNWVRSR